MKTLEVVAGIIVFNGKILCMQRNAGKYDFVSYKYEFPGGKVEPGESKVAALKRELHEEMEMDVTVGEKDFFLTVHHEYPDLAITMHSYICRVLTDQFVRKEHVGHIWLEPQELLSLDWAPADIPIVQKLLEAYGHGL